MYVTPKRLKTLVTFARDKINGQLLLMFTINRLILMKSVQYEVDLWKDRKNIKPVSDMIYLGGFDSSIRVKYNPTFYVLQKTR